MGRQRLIVLTAILLFTKDYEVSAQYATVMECVPQSCATIARPIVQSAGQYILPTIIQPIIPGYDSYIPEPAPSYPNYGNYPAPSPGYPPIIVKEGDDLLKNLLYFLILSMGNNNNINSFGPSCGGCSSGSGKCQCCCNCSNCSKNTTKDTDSSTSGPVYIPVPIAIPVYTGSDGSRYIDGFCDDILLQDSYGQSCSCSKDNEISFIIRAE